VTSDLRIGEIILDTNAFLFFINNDVRLSETAKELFESSVELLISVASLWEIAIKVSTGKLELPYAFEDFIPDQLVRNEIEILPLDLSHLAKVSSLPFHHKDPFDRIIIAQSIVNNSPVAGADALFDIYGVVRVW